MLLSPFSVGAFNSADEVNEVVASRQLVKENPPWDLAERINQVYEEGLYRQYGWPGYGFPGSFIG